MTDYDTNSPQCHFVTVAEIIETYDGSLAAYMQDNQARNIIITMEVEMAVGTAKPKPHAAALAVSYDFGDAEELHAMAQHCFASHLPFAFGWVPADLFGTDKFGIFIEAGKIGELLANGLIDDIIQTVKVEEAVRKKPA